MKQSSLIKILLSTAVAPCSLAFTVPSVSHGKRTSALLQVPANSMDLETTTAQQTDLFVLEDFEDNLDVWTADMEQLNNPTAETTNKAQPITSPLEPTVVADAPAVVSPIDPEIEHEADTTILKTMEPDGVEEVAHVETATTVVPEVEPTAAVAPTTIVVPDQPPAISAVAFEELQTLVQTVVATEVPTVTAEENAVQEDSSIFENDNLLVPGKPIESSTTLHLEEEALNEISAPGTDVVDSLTAQLATVHRVISLLTKENHDLKKEQGLLSSPQQKKGLGSFVARKQKKAAPSSPALLELSPDDIETDYIVSLSMQLATARRAVKTLEKENRDLKCTQHASFSGGMVSLEPAQGQETFEKETVVAVHSAADEKKRMKRVRSLFKGAASIARMPFQKNVNALNENADEEENNDEQE